MEFYGELTFDSVKVSRFFRAFMNEILKAAELKLTRGGKHFEPVAYRFREPLVGVSMYKAFFNTNKAIDGQIYLNMNPSVKFFQLEPILWDFERFEYNERAIREEFTGRTVMTLYNCKHYRIDEIDFGKCPKDKFFCDMHLHNKEMSFADYIFENYKKKVSQVNQPMLRHRNKRTGQDIYLIPEF